MVKERQVVVVRVDISAVFRKHSLFQKVDVKAQKSAEPMCAEAVLDAHVLHEVISETLEYGQ